MQERHEGMERKDAQYPDKKLNGSNDQVSRVSEITAYIRLDLGAIRAMHNWQSNCCDSRKVVKLLDQMEEAAVSAASKRPVMPRRDTRFQMTPAGWVC